MPGSVWLWIVPALAVADFAACGGDSSGSDATDAGADEATDGIPGDADSGLDGAGDTLPGEVAPFAQTCGDGVVDPGEECDDGNRMNYDECDWLCREGTGAGDTPPVDGSVPPVEADRPMGPVEDGTAGSAVETARRLDLIWTGRRYAVAWFDGVPDGALAPVARFLQFGRTGRREGSEWQYVYPDGSPYSLALAWTGSQFGLAWGGTDSRIWIILLDQEGKPILGPEAVVEGVSAPIAALEWDGDSFALAWMVGDGPSVGFARVGTDLVVRSGPGDVRVPPADHAVLDMALASCGGRNIVVFLEGTRDGVYPGAGRAGWVVVDLQGNELGVPRFLSDRLSSYRVNVACAEIGSAVLVPFADSSGHTGSAFFRLDAAGEVFSPGRRLGSSSRSTTALASGAGGWAVADLFQPHHDGSMLIRTDDWGGVVSERSLDALPTQWQVIAIDFDGEGFGVAGIGATGPVYAHYVVTP